MDVLLCPYNYVLSPDIRKNTKLNIENAYIIFDEAHNVGNNSEKACFFKLSMKDLNQVKSYKKENQSFQLIVKHLE